MILSAHSISHLVYQNYCFILHLTKLNLDSFVKTASPSSRWNPQFQVHKYDALKITILLLDVALHKWHKKQPQRYCKLWKVTSQKNANSLGQCFPNCMSRRTGAPRTICRCAASLFKVLYVNTYFLPKSRKCCHEVVVNNCCKSRGWHCRSRPER